MADALLELISELESPPPSPWPKSNATTSPTASAASKRTPTSPLNANLLTPERGSGKGKENSNSISFLNFVGVGGGSNHSNGNPNSQGLASSSIINSASPISPDSGIDGAYKMMSMGTHGGSTTLTSPLDGSQQQHVLPGRALSVKQKPFSGTESASSTQAISQQRYPAEDSNSNTINRLMRSQSSGNAPSNSPPPRTGSRKHSVSNNDAGGFTSAEKDYVELVRRSSESQLTEKERSSLYSYLLSLTKDALMEFQVKSKPVTGSIAMQNKSKILNDLDVDNYSISFAHDVSAAAQIQERQVFIKLKNNPSSSSLRYQIFIPPCQDGSYSLLVSPSKGKMVLNKPLCCEFNLEFRHQKPSNNLLNVVVEMLVEGGYRHFFVVKSRIEGSNQNVAIVTQSALKLQTDTIFPGHSYSIPKPLVRLRMMLVHAKGLETVGIFRSQGAPWEVQALTTHLKKGTYYGCSDTHAIATCLKNYLKSLPPLFRKVPFEEISSPSSESWGNLSTKFGMEQSETEMVFWLLDLLVDVTLKVEANEMSSRSIATVMAPNLYHSSNSSIDPAENAAELTAFVGYLNSLIANRCEEIKKMLSERRPSAVK